MTTQEFEIKQLEDYLRVFVPSLAEQWQGATGEEMNQIEAIAGRSLPPFYRWFLSRMGKSMGTLSWYGLNFSASCILKSYAEKQVLPDRRFLLIASGCSDNNESELHHLFYDLETPMRGDALVVWGSNKEGRFETLREMLAWIALSNRIDQMSEKCEGIIFNSYYPETDSEWPDIDPRLENVFPEFFIHLDPLMSRLGFIKSVNTGSFCRLYERLDIVMAFDATPEAVYEMCGHWCMYKHLSFKFGSKDFEALQKIVIQMAAACFFEIDVYTWNNRSYPTPIRIGKDQLIKIG